jgi:hypothetical protein
MLLEHHLSPTMVLYVLSTESNNWHAGDRLKVSPFIASTLRTNIQEVVRLLLPSIDFKSLISEHEKEFFKDLEAYDSLYDRAPSPKLVSGTRKLTLTRATDITRYNDMRSRLVRDLPDPDKNITATGLTRKKGLKHKYPKVRKPPTRGFKTSQNVCPDVLNVSSKVSNISDKGLKLVSKVGRGL